MKHILLCTDGSDFAKVSYDYAAWLADRLEAEVDVLYVTDMRTQQTVSTQNYSGTIGLNASKDLLNKLVEIEHEKSRVEHERAKLILDDAETILKEKGVAQLKTIHETGFLVDCFHEFEPEADLIILGQRGEHAKFATGHLGANVERIVRASHKPCLVTTQTYNPIERLLLAYDGSKSCQQMLDFLTTSPAFQGLELHILTAFKKDEEKARSRLQEAKQVAENAGFQPICHTLSGNPETVIAQYTEDNQINLLLMGAYGHSRIRHLVIGSTTVQLLRSSQIPVLLFR